MAAWLARDQIDDALADLLPRGATAMAATESAMLGEWLGVSDRFPMLALAVR